MFLRSKVRRKDGKQHRYWSVVENTRVARGRVVQRHVLYLGELDDPQELAWRRSIEDSGGSAAMLFFCECRGRHFTRSAKIRYWHSATRHGDASRQAEPRSSQQCLAISRAARATELSVARRTHA